MSPRALLLPALASLIATAAQAQSSCSSDGQPQPVALLERFISADCDDCWTRATAQAKKGELAIDWIAPGARGDDAPLSAAATRDALERLHTLKRKPPSPVDTVRTARRDGAGTLRVARGPAFNGYMGASIESPDAGQGTTSRLRTRLRSTGEPSVPAGSVSTSASQPVNGPRPASGDSIDAPM